MVLLKMYPKGMLFDWPSRGSLAMVSKDACFLFWLQVIITVDRKLSCGLPLNVTTVAPWRRPVDVGPVAC